jgi:hypothetical protein
MYQHMLARVRDAVSYSSIQLRFTNSARIGALLHSRALFTYPSAAERAAPRAHAHAPQLRASRQACVASVDAAQAPLASGYTPCPSRCCLRPRCSTLQLHADERGLCVRLKQADSALFEFWLSQHSSHAHSSLPATAHSTCRGRQAPVAARVRWCARALCEHTQRL